MESILTCLTPTGWRPSGCCSAADVIVGKAKHRGAPRIVGRHAGPGWLDRCADVAIAATREAIG